MRSLILLAVAALVLPITSVGAKKAKKAKDIVVEAPVEAQATPANPATTSPTEVFTPPPPTSPQPNQTVASKVDEDWPKYDLGSKGHLNKSELGKWLTDLRAANSEPAPDAAWLTSAFAQTDTNRDQKISKGELITSLTLGR